MKKLLLIATLLFSYGAHAQTFTSAALVSIPDAPAPGISVPIVVSGIPTTINSLFGLSSACFDIVHTYDSDLLIRLKSPDGHIVFLAGGVGGGGHNFTNTCTDMTPGNPYIVNGAAPFSGTYFPQESLNGLNNGQDPNGTWYILIDDQAGNDTGHISSCSINFAMNPPADPPPPPILCPSCQCPIPGEDCDLLPDMTASGLIIEQSLTETSGLLNFSNATPNIGWGPMEIHGVDSCYCNGVLVPCTTVTCPGGDPIKQRIHQRIYHKRFGNDTLTWYDHSANLMSYHPSHGHIHVDNWANFTLRRQTSNPDARTWPIIGRGSKQSFCLINLGDCTGNYGYCVRAPGDTLTNDSITNHGVGYVTGCGLDQGIYTGSLDIYSVGLNTGIDLTNVCDGNYYVVSVTDIENNFLETNDDNNWVAVPVTLGQQAIASTDSVTFDYNRTDNTVHFYNTTPFTTGPFFWDFGDGTTDTTEFPVHVYANSGTYNVTLELLTKCKSPRSKSLTIDSFTGVENNISSVINFEVHPNPFNDQLQLNYFLVEKSLVKLDVLDILGRTVYSSPEFYSEPGRQSQELDLSGARIGSGIYFIRMNTSGGTVRRRIVKAN